MNTNALIATLIGTLALGVAATAGADPRQQYIDSTFAAMDGNGDGHVDKVEFAAFQQTRFDKQAASIDVAFRTMDTDSNGRISKAEAEVVPEIARYFDGLDSDGDGSLSLVEMQAAMVAAQTADAPAN